MNVVCHLRAARGTRTLAELARESGVLASELSRIETGRLLPADAAIPAMEKAYGILLAAWYDWHGPMLPVQMDADRRAA